MKTARNTYAKASTSVLLDLGTGDTIKLWCWCHRGWVYGLGLPLWRCIPWRWLRL